MKLLRNFMLLPKCVAELLWHAYMIFLQIQIGSKFVYYRIYKNFSNCTQQKKIIHTFSTRSTLCMYAYEFYIIYSHIIVILL